MIHFKIVLDTYKFYISQLTTDFHLNDINISKLKWPTVPTMYDAYFKYKPTIKLSLG